MIKKVLLFNTNQYMNPVVPPIGLEYIGSALQDEGYETELYESMFSSGMRELKEKVERCDVVCMTFRNLDTGSLFERDYFIDVLKRMVTLVKKFKDVKVVLGGQGFSIAPYEILDYTKADYGIVGRGENAVIDLINSLSEGVDVKRVYYGNDYPVYNKPHKRNILDYGKYVMYGASMGIATNTGCPENCNYCVEHKQAYEEIETENAVREVKELRKYTEKFIICDSEFNHNQKRSTKFLKRIIEEKLNIRYCVYLKPSIIDEEFAKALKESGCEGISIGIDSLTEHGIKNINRHADREVVDRMFTTLQNHGLSYVPSFVVGFPWNSIDELTEEIEFCEKYNVDYISLNMGVRLYPHTSFTQEMADELREHKERFKGVLTNNEDLLKPVYYIKNEEFMQRVVGLQKNHKVKLIGFDKQE